MYRISSTNRFYSGRRFDSMVAAVKSAKKWYLGGYAEVIDVVMDIDNKYYRVVWSPSKQLIGRRIWKGKLS